MGVGAGSGRRNEGGSVAKNKLGKVTRGGEIVSLVKKNVAYSQS